jgi:hypothetical protein
MRVAIRQEAHTFNEDGFIQDDLRLLHVEEENS